MISCESYRGEKLLEHAMKIIDRVQERQVQTLMNFNKLLGFMPGKETVHAIFIVRTMQKEYQKKFYMCFVDIKKALDGVFSKKGACLDKVRFIRSNSLSSHELV